MAVKFGLWDTESGNLVAAYDSEDAALALVRDTLQAHGRAYVASLALIREGAHGPLNVLAQGDDLVERVSDPAPSVTAATAVRHMVPLGGPETRVTPVYASWVAMRSVEPGGALALVASSARTSIGESPHRVQGVAEIGWTSASPSSVTTLP
jgi:hypothetical protein